MPTPVLSGGSLAALVNVMLLGRGRLNLIGCRSVTRIPQPLTATYRPPAYIQLTRVV